MRKVAFGAPMIVVLGFVSLPSLGERLPPAPGKTGRSATLATHGMVATSHPLAAQIGLDVLKKGGNAVDAAIAVNAALGLMEPMSCGIGGDLFAIVWDAKTQKLYGLNASGRSPAKATRALFAEKKLDEIPLLGSLSWSVPGCVDGWEELRRKFGTMTLAALLEPSIRYAEEGFPITEVIADYWKQSEKKMCETPEGKATYYPDGRAPREGEVFKNSRLAKSYREIAKDGRDAFYKGRLAREMVAYSDKVGGLFSMADFTDHTSTWVEPVHTTYRGYTVWQLPPPGQGIAVLQMLNLLEEFDLAKMGFNSVDYWHLLVEAKKLAFADRAKYYADPEFAQVPTAELISKKYAAERRKRIDLRKAAHDVEAGDPRLGKSETAYLCVVDKDRNCVSLIQSNYLGFGSGHVAGELGFGLQNRGALFSLDPNHPNTLEPRKRPFHTIIPGFVTKDDRPFFVLGVMGGDMQPQGQVQVLVNLIDFGMNVQAAGEAPRVEHVGSATPRGNPADEHGGTAIFERGFPAELLRAMQARRHKVAETRINSGGYQGILIDPKTNVLHGGSEYRKDGCAVGY